MFSAKDGERSAEMSDIVTGALFGDAAGSAEPGTTPFWEDMNAVVRKCAHFLIFSALGFCAANTARQLTADKKHIFFISLALGSFYGAADEWHQYFVPDRSCMWQDWLIDTAGAFLGVGVVVLVMRRQARKRKVRRT